MHKTILTPALIASAAAAQPTFPFTETFDSDVADWVPGGNPAGLVSEFGSEAGDGFLQITAPLTPSFGSSQTIAQARLDAGSSNNAFFGNWTAGSIGVLTFDVRHNAAFDLSFAARVATDSDLGGRPISGFPAFASTNETIVGADVWTTIRIPVTLSNPLLQEEVPGTFFAVASNVTVLQLLVEGIPDANIGEEVTFQFDNVSIDIPAPGAALAFGLGGLALARRRR
ncbi:MAG: hypothetical protein AAFR38_03770 [Planctomycetota bacterium]